MTKKIKLDAVYQVSDDVVAREIEGEMIIVPLTSGIGDMEDDLYALNDSGREIWIRLDGSKTLQEIVNALSAEYKSEPGRIEQDVLGLMEELFRRNMVLEK